MGHQNSNFGTLGFTFAWKYRGYDVPFLVSYKFIILSLHWLTLKLWELICHILFLLCIKHNLHRSLKSSKLLHWCPIIENFFQITNEIDF